MTVKYHVYTFLWNDCRLIKALLKHYETADHIVVYDGGSTDEGPDIVRRAGRELRMLPITDHLDDNLNIMIKNNVWKESKGKCDYVIVQDTDEFLFFPDYPNDILGGLTSFKDEGVTASYADGYSILTSDEEFAEIYDALAKDRHPTIGFSQILRGDLVYPRKKDDWIFYYDKPYIFSPSHLDETDFRLGQHYWKPQPLDKLKFSSKNPWLLHWRFAGEKHELERLKQYRERLKPQWAKKPNISAHYNKTDEEIQYLVTNRRNDPNIKDAHLVLFPDYIKMKPCKHLPLFLCQVFDNADTSSNNLRESNYETEIYDLIASLCYKPDCLFIDVGAFTGSYSFTAAAAGAKKIISIECYIQSFEKLKDGVKVNGWENKIDCYNNFMTNMDDKITIIHRLPCDIAATSINKIAFYEIPVITKTLDSMLNSYDLCIYKNIVVNIDTNGHEIQVLEGMKDLLDKHNITLIIKNELSALKDFNFKKINDFSVFSKPLTD